jgi:hypothetical protein
LDLDDAADPVLRVGGGVEPSEECERLIGLVLRKQHARQHEVRWLSRIVRIVCWAEGALGCPPRGCVDVALREQESCPLRRNGVEQVAHGRVGGSLGLSHGVQSTGRVASGVSDPRQRRRAVRERVGNDELAAQREALGEVLRRNVELTALVGDLGHAHVRGTCGRQGRLAGCGGEVQCLLIGPERPIQATLRTLDPAQVLGPESDHVVHAGRLPPCDARGNGALGRPESATEPLCRSQLRAGEGVQHPLVLVELDHRLRCERHCSLAVAAQIGDKGASDRDHCGDVRQPARAPPDRGLVRFVSDVRERPLGGIQQALDFL